MGVHGLWRLIEPSGKPVPVESLENKVLAVDVSIWLHQAIKGFQDARGAPALNAHLLLIFHRICKLLYFKVKPIFVFDGGVPALKKQTIAKRHQLKHRNISEADKIHKQLLDTLIKHSAVNKVLGEKAKEAITSLSPPKVPKSRETEDLFKLPDKKNYSSESSSEDESSDSQSPTKNWNLHNIDTKSDYFKSLPADVRHEILTDLKETRKQSSWGRLHELPTQSDDFSGFQMKRLLKRYEVQSALEEAAQEIGGHSLSLAELEDILKDQGIISDHLVKGRIASDENKRYLYVRDIKQAIEHARRKKEKEMSTIEETPDETSLNSVEDNEIEIKATINKADLELNEEIEKAIVLSLQDQPSSSGISRKKKLSEFSFLENFNDEDFVSDESDDDKDSSTVKNSKLKPAQNYMMEYTGLTPNEIEKIISKNENIKIHKKTNEKKKDTEVKNAKICGTNEIVCEEKTDIHTSLHRETQSHIVEVELEEKTFDEVHYSKKETLQKKFENENEEITSINQDECQRLEKIERNNVQPPISEKEETVKDVTPSSEDSEDDFEEVSAPAMDTEKKNVMEIQIETGKFDENDDLFSDIFTEENHIQPQQKIDDIEKKDTSLDSSLEKTELIERRGKIIEEPTTIQEKNELEFEQIKDQNQELIQTIEKQVEKKVAPKITEDDLMKMKDDLDKEQMQLRSEQGLRERLGTNITDQMYKEAQDLLELFGLPYVIAPMEAEAQCAYLELLSLTDGTITDDSDIWLFGGKTVYKNFFNQSKHVLEYRADDIKHHFKLTREQMILLALLVGSDYTVGLQGVGPVTALEILAAFPPANVSTFTVSHNQLLMGLKEFKLWFVNGKTAVKGKQTLRNKLKNITFTDSFPSTQVVEAYLNPTVDKNEENFTWSKPDVVSLYDFGRSKFGWSKTKTEDILKPVLKKMKETKYQSTLLNYFQIKHNLSAEEAQKLMSERVKLAVKRIGQDPDDSEDKESEKSEVDKKKIKPRKRKSNKSVKLDTEKLFSGDEFIECDEIEALLSSLEKDSQTGEKSISEQKEAKQKKPLKRAKNIEENNDNTSQITINNSKSKITNDELSMCSIPPKKLKKIEKEQTSTLKQSKRPYKKKLKTSKDTEENSGQKEHNSGKKRDNDEISTFSNLSKKIKKTVDDEKDHRLDESNADKTSHPQSLTEDLAEELKLLQATKALSEKKVEEIRADTEKQIEQEMNKKKFIQRKLHHKEIIPQKERDKRNLMRTKMKAIEVFRKSKIDPSSKKKDKRKAQTPREDAGLSEESSDSDL